MKWLVIHPLLPDSSNETYDQNLQKEDTDADKETEDLWLQYLDRLAVQIWEAPARLFDVTA